MALTHGAGTIQSLQNDTLAEVKLTIHHQFPGIELVSPVYASDCATCYLSPDQKVDVGSTMQASFNIDPGRNESIGALLYKLQKKNAGQSNEDGIFSEEEEACTQLLMIWKVNSSREFFVVSDLIEHDNYVWDRDRLMEFAEYCRLFNAQHGPIEETWLIRDNTVLMTSLNIAREVCYKLEMTISETSIKDDDTQRPRYIDVDR
jgi:hypothetical protein